jgi:hypothetical protein
MNSKSLLRIGLSLSLGVAVFGGASLEPQSFNIGSKTVFFEPIASAQTSNCLTVYSQLGKESIDTGGDYGLVNEKTSLSTAWAKLKAASDATLNEKGNISDGKSNTYVNYVQSSTQAFASKNYTIVGSISLSGGPDAKKKIRFTKS